MTIPDPVGDVSGGAFAPQHRVTFDGPVRIFQPGWWGDGRPMTFREKVAARLGLPVHYRLPEGRINHVPEPGPHYDEEGREVRYG